ncbi:PspC domain-containing protein [Mucilaginibacter sp.]|uniref:PspC domain-containing protein n=1 Tax=Mucilaginibacter sp. TaxID=1882438 RepID=UPI003D0D1734
MNKKLYRDEYHKVLGGVCSGMAEYFEMDVTIVRLLFAFTFFIMGVGLGTYIILWIVLPRKGYIYNNPTVDYTVSPQNSGQYTQPQDGNPFGNNLYNNNPFAANTADNMPKQKSHAGIIFGTVLIVIGAITLIENFDLIPDIDFERLWPIALVIVGGALIASGERKRMFHNQNWEDTDKKAAPATEPESSATNDNNSTVEL